MKKQILVSLAAFVVLSYVLAYAQPATVNIDFPFVAGGKTLPAGKYTVEMPTTDSISFFGPGGKSVMIVLTRLGRHDTDTDLEVVFDKVGGKMLLSEVWFPNQDGYLLLATKEAHEHAVLGGSNPRK